MKQIKAFVHRNKKPLEFKIERSFVFRFISFHEELQHDG